MEPNWCTDSLAELNDIIWASLTRACSAPGEPWRLPALATLGTTGPQARTVVLREADADSRHLVAWTDVRSPKVAELRREPRAHWLFHDPANGRQLRASTLVRVHHDNELARAAWATVPEANRANYQGVAVPGTVTAQPASAGQVPDGARPPQFAVLVATVYELDWLWLDPHGHRRAWFRWTEERWTGAWLVP